ncbi:MAG: ABC transporter permease [Anaerolineaceae bacterium]|nr:ABC transporter permease [Anaerolineaceae bacterium]MCY3907191.1 ABC transporter permease [Anaerolineaceae bacterium]
MAGHADLLARRARVRARHGLTGPERVPDRSREALPEADADQRHYYAGQWRLMWWRFRRHRMALLSSALLLLLYLIAALAEFIAPYEATQRFRRYQQAPPSTVYWSDENGLRGPYVYGLEQERDPVTLRLSFVENRDVVLPLQFFVETEPYRLAGLVEVRHRLFGLGEAGDRARIGIWVFGLDSLARDVFSRTVYGARISLTIGLVSVALTFFLGALLGGMSGYFGGVIDYVIQRVIEFLRAIPQLPLWMTLAAVVPKEWPPLYVYFAITLILALLNWVGLARVVRGRLLSLREEDYALAARASGAGDLRIIFSHLLPGFTSHLILSVTLMIPQMVLYETALSFLGLGMQPPAVSWGVLLQDFRDIVAIFHIPWLLWPAICVLLTVLLFNFVGDGLRDAADPYSSV